MSNYIAIIHKDPDSDFGVSFPDFPGCVSAAGTLDEAKDMAKEALSLHLRGMIEDGEKIPAPSQLEDLTKDPEYSDAIAFLVIDAPESKPKAVRVNVTIPEDTLQQIDATAKKRGMSRSSFLVNAARSKMKPPSRVKSSKRQSSSG
ncbi:type II toxin-antitoxin system HicB family antitoxin [Thermodesulfobacteriota bacterium]